MGCKGLLSRWKAKSAEEEGVRIPPDGGWGWVVVAGTASIFLFQLSAKYRMWFFVEKPLITYSFTYFYYVVVTNIGIMEIDIKQVQFREGAKSYSLNGRAIKREGGGESEKAGPFRKK